MTGTGYFDTPEYVEEYIKNTDPGSGDRMVHEICSRISTESRLLELGMGPGNDFRKLMSKGYDITGTDHSEVFLEMNRKEYPDSNILYADARDIRLEEKFAGIYSNKVLHHLLAKEMRASVARQCRLLNPDGYLFHTFWASGTDQEYFDLHFEHYTVRELKAVFSYHFRKVELIEYAVRDTSDSILVIANDLYPE